MSRPAVQLDSFSLHHAPGIIDGGFNIDALSPGINLVYGSNGSGKSTMALLIELLLCGQAIGRHNRLATDSDVVAGFVFNQRRYRLHRRYDHVEASCDGQRIDPPQLGPADHPDRYRLAMGDLFRSDGQAFARSVLEAMRGGYDVQAAGQKLGLLKPGRLDTSLIRPLETARADYRQAVQSHDKVAAQAEQLQRLRREAEQVDQARTELPQLEALADWHTKSQAAEDAHDRLKLFDPRIAKLRLNDETDVEDDRRIIERFAKREAELGHRHDQAAEQLSQARQARDRIDLPPQGLSEEQLERWASLCDSVEDADDQIERLTGQIAGEQEQADEIRRRISDQVTDEQLEALDQTAEQQLSDFAKLVGEYEAKRQFIAERKRWLSESDNPPDESDQLDQGVVLLSQWLRAYGSGPDWPALIWPLVLVAGITVVLTGVMALVWAPVAWAAGLAGVAAMLGVTVWQLRRSDSIQSSSRQTYQRDYESTHLPMPESWNEAAVSAVLNDLMGRQQARALHDRQADLRRELEDEQQQLEQLKTDLDHRRERLHRELGFAPSVDDHWLAGLVEQVNQWRKARNKLHQLTGSCRSLRDTQRHDAGRLHEELAAYDHQSADGPEALNHDALEQRLKALGRRESDRQKAEQAIEQAQRQLNDAAEALEQCRRQYRAVFDRLGVDVGDESTVRQLIQQHAAYLEATQEDRDAQRDAQQARQRVAAYGDWLEWSADDIAQRRRKLEAVIESGQDLHQQIGQITAQIDAAKRGHDIADALATIEAEKQKLAEQRQRHIDGAVANILVDFVNRQTAEQTQPIVFKAARELLGRFTEWRYELEIDGRQADGGQFTARDSRDELVKQLAELSAGERMQLLLAVRLAFVEAQESQARLPLLLDEVLGVSDDDRTLAIIKAVITIARAGRQVFYFTAQRDEQAKWRRQLDDAGLSWAEHDLDALRGRGRSVELPLEVDHRRPRVVPAPDGAGRADYARRIGVTGIDRWSESQANLHLWHVVEDMDELHQLLARRIETWGPYAHYAERVGRSDSAVAAQHERLSRRVAVIRQACEAWRHGRAQPITRGQLADADGISRSSKFEDAADLLEGLRGDAQRFIQALRQGRISRLQTAIIDETESWLIDRGHIDPRQPLDAPTLIARIEAAATRYELNNTSDRHFMQRLIAELAPAADRDI